MKKALITLITIGIILLGYIGYTFIHTEEHCGVVTTTCRNGAEETWEYNVSMDGGGYERVSSTEYYPVGSDISIVKNYWNTWEK